MMTVLVRVSHREEVVFGLIASKGIVPLRL